MALQSDGWFLRQTIIWHKPNPMPESVSDRCTKAHEYIFLLSKSKKYYYDSVAVQEPSLSKPMARNRANGVGVEDQGNRVGDGNLTANCGVQESRNRRSVWTIATRPFKGAHFATFPPALVEPCILAGSKVGDTVLDPFGGAGTVGLVAMQHGRKSILCELNPDYAEMARQRIEAATPAQTLFDTGEV